MAHPKTAGKLKVAAAFLLLLGPAILLIFFSTKGCSHNFKKLDDFGKLKSFNFTDASGVKRSSDFFKNNIVLITVIEESCPDTCSISMWHLDHLIYQNMRKSKKEKNAVRIITFVVDKDGKPVKNLRKIEEYLKNEVEDYDPKYWILASGETQQIYDITSNNQNLLEESEDLANQKTYREIMLLADKNMHLRMAIRGKQEGMIRRMREHLALLQKQYDLDKK